MNTKFYSAYSPFGGGWFVMFCDQDGVQRRADGPFDTKIDADIAANKLNGEPA